MHLPLNKIHLIRRRSIHIIIYIIYLYYCSMHSTIKRKNLPFLESFVMHKYSWLDIASIRIEHTYYSCNIYNTLITKLYLIPLLQFIIYWILSFSDIRQYSKQIICLSVYLVAKKKLHSVLKSLITRN